jgi:transcriptional regulator with XRE-family HTH domain
VLSDTLRDGLEAYGIGPRIRALRLKKSMGLVELGRHSGLSPALLSKVERGRLYPTLPTLLRIALVFSVGLDHFFAGPRKPAAVVRRAERLRLPDTPDDDPSFYFESLDFPIAERKLSGYFAEFVHPAPAKPRTHEHVGGELIYMLQGSLEVLIGDDSYRLKTGDSMYFDSGVPHAYRSRGGRPARALVVVSPA